MISLCDEFDATVSASHQCIRHAHGRQGPLFIGTPPQDNDDVS